MPRRPGKQCPFEKASIAGQLVKAHGSGWCQPLGTEQASRTTSLRPRHPEGPEGRHRGPSRPTAPRRPLCTPGLLPPAGDPDPGCNNPPCQLSSKGTSVPKQAYLSSFNMNHLFINKTQKHSDVKTQGFPAPPCDGGPQIQNAPFLGGAAAAQAPFPLTGKAGDAPHSGRRCPIQRGGGWAPVGTNPEQSEHGIPGPGALRSPLFTHSTPAEARSCEEPGLHQSKRSAAGV